MPASADRFDARILLLLAVTVGGAIVALLDASIVNVGIDRLARSLDAPLSTMQWVTTAYLLALVVAMPTAAWATDRYGGRAVFAGALAIFVAGSALCATAWSAESLIAFRALQGLGGGALEPTMFTVLARAVGRGGAGRMVGLVGAPLMLGPALGPLVGGTILEHLPWQWMFLVNVPIGLVLIVLALRIVPSERAGDTAGVGEQLGGDAAGDAARTGEQRGDTAGAVGARVDLVGIALLTGAAVGFMLGFSRAAHDGFGAPPVLASLVAGVALLAAYVPWARRLGRRAVVDLRLFRHGRFAVLAGANGLNGTMLYPLLFLVPLYFQQARGTGVLAAGALLVPEAIGAAAGFRIGGQLTARVGARRLVPLGSLVYGAAIAPFALAGASSPLLPSALAGWSPPLGLLAAALAVAGLGFGVAGGAVLGSVYATVPGEDVSRASATLFMCGQLGGAVGVAVATLLLGTGAPQFGDAFAAVILATVFCILASPLLPGPVRTDARAGIAQASVRSSASSSRGVSSRARQRGGLGS